MGDISYAEYHEMWNTAQAQNYCTHEFLTTVTFV